MKAFVGPQFQHRLVLESAKLVRAERYKFVGQPVGDQFLPGIRIGQVKMFPLILKQCKTVMQFGEIDIVFVQGG